MDTRFWGPDGWKLLHSICVNYDEKYKLINKTHLLLFDKYLFNLYSSNLK